MTRDRIARWRIESEEFDYDIHHIQGKHNDLADGLSRVDPIVKECCDKPAIGSVNACEDEDKERKFWIKLVHEHELAQPRFRRWSVVYSN